MAKRKAALFQSSSATAAVVDSPARSHAPRIRSALLNLTTTPSFPVTTLPVPRCPPLCHVLRVKGKLRFAPHNSGLLLACSGTGRMAAATTGATVTRQPATSSKSS
ncbi:hypothetical protein SKAU_G00372850 [Synaphobranchus kaupii]|uniref:Uncharacterized protein n=1 Tax=Synaphobranchus kaupii TaxID=118154 RepID=A0A9Q1EGF1_SYNKA|nr:hypothetical protein SKAU_G00372850 [Synaphobranchus kaupii]